MGRNSLTVPLIYPSLTYHPEIDDLGAKDLATARMLLERYLAIDDANVNDLLAKIYAMSFKWGVSDGN
jgi:hypothetical protein